MSLNDLRWASTVERGTAQGLHDRPMTGARAVTRCLPSRPALVLGSTQVTPPARPGDLDLARRPSGGGAVIVGDGTVLWVDVDVSRDDSLWSDDVGRAFWWLGDAWVMALASLGVLTEAYRGPLVRSKWSDAVCFAGLGPGEVTLRGRKVVGMAQRRTRAGARFHCAVVLRWRPEVYAAALSLPPDVIGDLAPMAGTLALGEDEVMDAFLTALGGVE